MKPEQRQGADLEARLRALPQPPVPADLEARLLARIPTTTPAPKPWRAMWVGVAAIVTVA
jgi:hypothetical protein